MKKISKILSVVLSLIMIISATTITTSAATYSGYCGSNVKWSYNTTNYTLTISGTGAMYDYDYFNHPWESHANNIKKVIIKDGVTTIGDWAFCFCENLTSATIGNSVTTIGTQAFWNSGLTSVTIGDGVIVIGIGAFEGCNLTSITLPNSVTLIDVGAFCGCSFASITLPNSVKVIGARAFSDCRSLENITIPDSVTTIDAGAFAYCDSLTSIAIPKSVTTIGSGAFYACSNLSSVIIPDSVTSIGLGAFEACAEIKVGSNNKYFSNDENGVLFNKDKTILLQYPGGNTRKGYTIPDSVKTIGEWAFYTCQNITSITIPNGVTTISDESIYHCYSLTNITIPNSVKTIGNSAFEGCDLADVYYGGTRAQWYGISIGEYNDGLTNATIHYNFHIHDYETIIMPATCIQNGYTTCVCDCGESYIANILPATGHKDADADAYCDTCDELLCHHSCHTGGLFWIIINFFNMIFGANRYCECGVAHY